MYKVKISFTLNDENIDCIANFKLAVEYNTVKLSLDNCEFNKENLTDEEKNVLAKLLKRIVDELEVE